jgi:3-methyladenine DNA glycosylase AlkC
MPEAFKDLYNEKFYSVLAAHLKKCLADFNQEIFMKLILPTNFQQLELKQRMTHTKEVLHQFMPKNFPQATDILAALIDSLVDDGIKEGSVEYMFLPEYIETYGIDDYQTSIAAFEKITQFTSAEFAVRPFLIKYEQQMLTQMFLWCKHSNYLVRRLASEGSRPRLPWAIDLRMYKDDATLLLPILHALFNDPTEIVRRSVANNLNDIAKDNPETVIKFAKQYIGKNTQADRTIKHASRTLLKRAFPEALALFGYDSTNIELIDFEVLTEKVTVGTHAEFSFSIKNNSEEAKRIRLEYGLYFMKKNGQLTKKVFKISERLLAANEKHQVLRKQSFKPISTRIYHAGIHQVSIILNGKEFAAKDFELISIN